MLSMLEHHSNIVPWQMAAERVGDPEHLFGVGVDGGVQVDFVLLAHGYFSWSAAESLWPHVGATPDLT